MHSWGFDLQRPGLFAGCHVYLSGKFDSPTMTSRDDLTRLLQQGGATIHTREPRTEHLASEPCTVPYHASTGSKLEMCSHYIVQDRDMSDRLDANGRLCYVKPSWVLDSIANFKLLEVSSLDSASKVSAKN